MKITLMPDHSPFNCRPRRLSHCELVQLQQIIDDLLQRGVIRESNSPYSSPIILVRKKTGEFVLTLGC